MTVLETERLLIRRWRADDWKLLRPMSNDVDVMKYLGGSLLTDDQIREIERRQTESFDTLGYCYWPLELKSTGAFIGLCGVQPQLPDPYDYGWRLAREHWNHGYITEAATAVRDYAFGSLKLPELTSTALVVNTASINVMQKVGMTFVETTMTEWGEVSRYALKNPMRSE